MTTRRLAETLLAAGPRRVALLALGFGDPPQRPGAPTVAERDRDAVFTALAAEMARWLQGGSPSGALSRTLALDLATIPDGVVRSVAQSLYGKPDPILSALGWELYAALALIDQDLVTPPDGGDTTSAA